MFHNNTDREWENFGTTDPYFGVLSHERFRKANLTTENLEEFFQTGREYVDTILTNVRTHMNPDFSPRRALEFGCGVGRLLIPLSQVAEEVVGVDVSDSMLTLATKNCEERSIANVRFLKADDQLSSLTGKFDFIHSYIVFQHIPVRRGECIFKRLLGHMEDGGIGVVHFTYAQLDPLKRIIPLVKNYVPFAKNALNLIKGRRFFAPEMQMYTYDTSKLLSILHMHNTRSLFVTLANDRDTLEMTLYFKKGLRSTR